MFIALGFDWKAEGLKVETHPHFQLGLSMIAEDDICRVAVVGRPFGRMAQQRPDVRGCQAGDDHLIGGEVFGEAGQIAFWPDDLVHGI